VTLLDYGRILRERLTIVASGLVVGLGAALLIVLLVPPTYSATISMYVSAQTDQNATEAYEGAQLSQARIISYVELVTRPRVTRAVIDQLGLRTTPAALAEQLSASSEQDSVLLDVTAATRDPQESVAVVNAVGRVFPAAVDELERPLRAGATPPVTVRVVEPADTVERTSPTWPVVVAFGVLAGLVMGAACALLRHATDTSVRSTRALAGAVDLPLLATTFVERSGSAGVVPTRDLPSSPTAEAIRRLRTNLQYLDVDDPPRVLAVASSVPAEGKTTVACDLAIALAAGGGEVLLIEADLRRPGVADRLGLERTVGLTTVLAGRVDLADAIQQTVHGAAVLTSGPLVPTPGELLASHRMQMVLAEARTRYDHIVLDTAPLLTVSDAAAVVPLADGVLLLCRWGSTSSTRLAQSLDILRAVSARTLGVILSLAPARQAPADRGGYGDLPVSPEVPDVPTAAPGLHASPGPGPSPGIRRAVGVDAPFHDRKPSHGR
jgi:succinoglycan biosynthesis transport protein ExoP